MKLGSEDLRTVRLTSSPLAGGTKSPGLQSKKRKANTKITHVVSKKTGKPFCFVEVSEADFDAAEAEIAADPPQIDGFLGLEEIEMSEQADRLKEQIIQASEELDRLSKGEGIGTRYAHGCTIELAKTLLCRHNDLACDEPLSAQGQASGVLFAEIAHSIASESPFTLTRRKKSKAGKRKWEKPRRPLGANSAFMRRMTGKLGQENLRLSGADSTKLVLEVIAHYDAALEDVVWMRAKGAELSEEQQRVVKYEWFFDSSKPVSKPKETIIFNKLLYPWIMSPPGHELLEKKYCSLCYHATSRATRYGRKMSVDLRDFCRKSLSTIVAQKNKVISRNQNRGKPIRLRQ
jgi:hypothetical protein